MKPNLPNIRVRKNTGELVGFDISKLRNALVRSGADEPETDRVIEELLPALHDGISTRKIYQLAYSILRKISHGAAGRYKLKQAMFELGPTGFPFEQLVAKLLQNQGYKVTTDQFIKGKCVQHEVDVVARNGEEQIMVECKYHSDKQGRSDVKVPLYIHSRFEDVKRQWELLPENRGLRMYGMVVTNSRFTDDALQFGLCAGLIMVSWDHPSGNALKDWIDRSGYHPVTSLHTITREEKRRLLDKGIILCRDLAGKPEILRSVLIKQRKADRILKEVNTLCRAY